MKKKSLKSLALKKEFISNLNNTKGGKTEMTFEFGCQVNSEYLCHPDPDLSIGYCPTAETCVGSCACQMTQEANCPSDSDSMVCA